MKNFTLHGRCAYPGTVEGYAVVCPDSIAGNSGGVGDTDGIIYEAGNSARGQCIKDKILILPGAKGSNGFSAHFKAAALAGFAPAGWVVTGMDSRIGGTLASIRTPAVCDITDGDPLALFKTGDYVRLDANSGAVTLLRRDEE